MKKTISLLLSLCMMCCLVACGGGDAEGNGTDTTTTTTSSVTSVSGNTDTDSVTDSTTDTDSNITDSVTDGSSSETIDPPAPIRVKNLVMANDQWSERVVIYDMDKYTEGASLDDLEIWSIPTGHAAGLKYREGTVFGDVLIVAGSKSAIYKYPSGVEVWSTTNPGNNTHSIEILPSGNIVVANSTGGNLRFFYSSSVINEDSLESPQSYVDYPLAGAHGVLWDPENEVLWALGDYELCAYILKGEDDTESLVKVSGMGVELPKGMTGGHDLSPDYSDTRYLYFTVNSCVLRFDKETNEIISDFEDSDKLNGIGVKGFSNNPNGVFFMAGIAGGAGTQWEDWWKASWCTDTIYYCFRDADGVLQKIPVVSTESAFYKVRVFYGLYQ